MSSISAGTSSGTALVSTGDTSGALQLQVNGTTPSITLAADGSIGVGSTPSYGTSGQLLTSAGTGSAPTWTTVSSGLSLVSTQSGSGSSAVTWSGLSGSTNYLLVLSGLADTTTNRDTRIRVGTGGTIITSGYVYSGQIYGAGGPAAYGGTGAGLILSLDGAYLRYFYGFIHITQPPNYSAVNFNGATNDNTSASFGNTITGAVPTSAIISDIRIYSPNNFNFGSAALYKMAV